MTPSPGPEWTDNRAPRTPAERRHKRQWEAGRAAVLAWIGHPAVAREVGAIRHDLIRLAEPLEMSTNTGVALKVARLLDVTPVWPDGSRWDNPYLGASEALIEATARLAPELLARLQDLARRIEAAGAGLDPSDPGTLLVIAQIALVPVDLRRPPTILLDGLNTLPPGWLDRDAAAMGHVVTGVSRHGRSARFASDLSALAEAIATELGPPRFRLPYAGGRPRRRPTMEDRVEARRAALREVLSTHPRVTAGRLRATWTAGPSTPGGLLRSQLGLQPEDRPPGETTLRADLRELRR